jgi:hypothetical protein
MIPDETTFDKAIENITAGTEESNNAWVKVIVGNEDFHTFVHRTQDLYEFNPDVSLGTLFQLGVETGIEYQKLVAEREVADAAASTGTAA